jgi:LDH2 family malate/lactate/ureidoglycolate dehydrogenase
MSITDTRPRYRAEDLRRFTTAVFEHFGVAPDDAAMGAEVLVDADLAGIESHGIAHLPWHAGYAPGLKDGRVNPRPNIAVLRDSPVAAAWDADAGLGAVVARKAMEACIAKAESTGVGMVTVRNGRHFGAAGYYARMAAERDMIGMAMCNVPPIGVAAGGLERRFGTNPIAFAAPVADDHPFLLDMATTAVAAGKLEIAMRQGKPIPLGWAIDAAGNDTSDPILRGRPLRQPLDQRLQGLRHGLMVDILTSVLSGLAHRFTERGPLRLLVRRRRIDAFRDPVEFKADMKRMVTACADQARTRVNRPRRRRPPKRRRADRRPRHPPRPETVEQLRRWPRNPG